MADSLERCKNFKAKPLAERKKLVRQCRDDGGSWNYSYCVCKKKSKIGIR